MSNKKRANIIHYNNMADLIHKAAGCTVYVDAYRTAHVTGSETVQNVYVAVRWFTETVIHSYTPYHMTFFGSLNEEVAANLPQIFQDHWSKANDVANDIEELLRTLKMTVDRGIVDLQSNDPIIGSPWLVGSWKVAESKNQTL